MGLFAAWTLASEVTELEKRISELEASRGAMREALSQTLASQVADMQSRIDRHSLGWAELHDKTLHYMKRIEQRQRDSKVQTEDLPKPATDQITERVRARRLKGREA